MSALSTLGFALNVIRKTARENPSWNWNSYLAGPDGIMAPCSLVGEARYNPISVSAAIQCRFGELCNNCWDDGVLQDLIAGRVLIGPLGLSLRKANDGSARPFLPPNPGSCSPWSDAHLSPAIAHVWLKISDNNELDNNPAVDTDSVVILRILAAAKNLPFDGPSLTGKQRNSVARLEAWLRRNADGSLTVLSVRQVTS
jgi:hypothetical protein